MKLYLFLFLAVFSIGIASAQVSIVNDTIFNIDNSAFIKLIAPQTSTNIAIYNSADSPASTLQFYINGIPIRFTADTNKTLSNISYDNVNDLVTYSGNSTIGGYLNVSARMASSMTNYNFNVDGNTNQTGESNVTGWVTFNYTGWELNQHEFKISIVSAVPTYLPPTPEILTATTGNFWVNTTWRAGAGNITNSYNVNVNGVWTNGSANTYYNSTLSAHAWQNLTIYARNSSGTGRLSTTALTNNTLIPNNNPVQSLPGNKSVDEKQALSFTVSATDADGDTLTYGTNATKGSLNTTTGVFTWTPTFGESGTYVWYFNSTDIYSAVASETITVTVTNIPLTITSRSPVNDPATSPGTGQSFSVNLNRSANVIWYINGTPVQTNTSITSASYTNLTAGIGIYNVTASVSDTFDTTSAMWNWTVTAEQTYIPPSPENIASTTGNFWVNTNWQAGTGNGNITNSYNVNINGTWTNGTTNMYINSTLSSHAWQNLSVYAWNSSGIGTLNTTPAMLNTRIPNNNPVQAGIGGKIVDENQTLSFTVSATDADSDTITYGTNATRGDFNTSTGSFTWAPTFGESGTYVWSFNSSDVYGGIDNETITVIVTNIPLIITSRSPVSDPATTPGTGQSFAVNLNRSANVTWYMNGTPVQTNTSITSASYTNRTAGLGIYNITAVVSDAYDTVSAMWNWTVYEEPTYIPPSPVNLAKSTGNFYVNHSWNAGGGNVTDSYNVSVNGNWYNGTNTYYNNSGLAPHGWSNITVYSFNSSGTGTLNATPATANIQVANNVPVLAPIGNKEVTAGALLTFTLSVTDADSDQLTNTTNASKGSFTPGTGVYTWTPASDDIGTYHWEFNISDSYGGTDSETITVTVNAVPANHNPVQQPIGNKFVDENQTLSFKIITTDADRDTITFGTNAAKGSLNPTTGVFTWTPTFADAGVYVWYFNSNDGHGGVASETITITVNNILLTISSRSPTSDLVTSMGKSQNFIVNLNRSANVKWYINGTSVQVNNSVTRASYTNLTAGVGVYNIKAIVSDAYDTDSTMWNWTVVKAVTTDTTPPLLIVEQPINGQTFAVNMTTVSGTASDASGIANVTVNGILATGTTTWIKTITLTPGTNNVTVVASDDAGNTASVTISVTYMHPVVADTTAPLLIVTRPVNYQNFSTNSITVSGFATDASGIYSVTVNGAPATISGNSFSFSLKLNAGTNFIEIEAIDSSSNHNRVTINRTVIYSPSVVLDTTPPELFVNQPVSGKNFITNSITVSGTALDDIGIDSVSVNGAIIAISSGPFSTNVHLTPGTNIITIIADDNAGNTASVTRTVTYTPPVVPDTTPPLLTVYQPANGQNFVIDSITVSGTAYDTSGIYSVYINGYAVPVSYTGSFSRTVYLVNGSNNITVSATDDSTNANIATLTRTITYTPPVVADTTPPLLILDQPTNGQVLSTSPITVSGKAIDDSGIRSVTVNGVTAYLTYDGRFGISVDLNIGTNTIVVQAIDSSSHLNTNITTLTVTRIIPPDTEPPVLIVTYPTEGLVIGSFGNTIEVSGTVSDNTGVGSVMVNGILATLVDESFDAIIPLTIGPNIITIIVTDNSTSRNSKTITRNLTYFVPGAEPGPESNIALISNPPVLVADGKDMANITAHITDANGTDVVDGTEVKFITTHGRFYLSKADVGTLPGNTELTVKTRNGSAKIVLISSTIPGTALVSAHANKVNSSLDIAFMASTTLKSKIGDTTLHIVHSPVIPAYNSSIELNGRVGSIRTSTELSAGLVNGTFVSYSIGTATIDIIISNPVVSGDQTIFTVDSLLLNNSPISSTLRGIGEVKSDVDVGINTASTLGGMKFDMSLYKDIADELRARGGTDADINSVLANLEFALGMKEVSNRIAFITAARLDGATAKDILEVPISMTVSGDWYNNTAASQLNNVLLVEIFANGSIEQIQAPEKYTYDSVNDSYTFVFRMKGFSTFALIGTKIAPPSPTPTSTTSPTPPPASVGAGGGGGGGGIISPEPFSNIESFEMMDEYLAANVPASYIFTSPDLEISEVLITPSDNFGITSVRVELLKDVSKISGVTPPLGIVYKYYNIWVGAKQLESGEGIIDAFIGFKVDKSWLAENNLEEGSVSLLGWDGSTWVSLETAPKSLDEQFVYYVAKTNAFLPFAIVAGSHYPSATVKAGKTPAFIIMPLPKIIESKFFMWVYILIGFILIGFVIYRLRKYKKSKTVHGKSKMVPEKAIESMPEDADAWYNRGFDLYEQGKYDEALKAYDKSIDIMHKKEKKD